jgi:hypothetical protein
MQRNAENQNKIENLFKKNEDLNMSFCKHG